MTKITFHIDDYRVRVDMEKLQRYVDLNAAPPEAADPYMSGNFWQAILLLGAVQPGERIELPDDTEWTVTGNEKVYLNNLMVSAFLLHNVSEESREGQQTYRIIPADSGLGDSILTASVVLFADSQFMIQKAIDIGRAVLADATRMQALTTSSQEEEKSPYEKFSQSPEVMIAFFDQLETIIESGLGIQVESKNRGTPQR